MSSQRSNWRERLYVNPSRMEHELAAKLESSGFSTRPKWKFRLRRPISISPRSRDQHWFSLMEHLISQPLNDQGRRIAIPSQETRIQSSRASVQELLRQETG